MVAASTLSDLLKIRDANWNRIHDANEGHGTFLGIDGRGRPSVFILLAEDHSPDEALSQDLKSNGLSGPGELSCPVVIVSTKGPSGDRAAVPPLEPENTQLVQRLCSNQLPIKGGAQITSRQRNERGIESGTVSCQVRRRSTGALGLLTNMHVAGAEGTPVFWPKSGATPIGKTVAAKSQEADEIHFGGIVDAPDALYQLDCAFVELSGDAVAQAQAGLHELGAIGAPIHPNLQSMELIGKKVSGVGAATGLQQGLIYGFAYEFTQIEPRIHYYSDFLIVGESQKAFSTPGDSGKLIVSAEEADRGSVVGLTWGGYRVRMRPGKAMEYWTFGIDINRVLASLDIEIVA